MVGSIGSYVDLEEALHIDRFVYLRLVECVGGHFFAGYAPVGVEIDQHGLAWVGFQSGIHSGFEFADIGKHLAVVGFLSGFGWRNQR